jgi:hypothetical protein
VSKKINSPSQKQCAVMFGIIRQQWGTGWSMMGRSLQQAIIAERVLLTLAANDKEMVSPEEIYAYLNAMCDYCGLSEPVAETDEQGV